MVVGLKESWSMQPFSSILCSLLLTTSLFSVYGQEIPQTFDFKRAIVPGYLWVSAAAALDPEGNLIEGSLPPGSETKLRRLLDRSEPRASGECAASLGPLHDKFAAPIDSWEDLKQRAAVSGRVIVGRISSSAAGFYSGSPYTVLRVDPAGEAAPVFLLYPYGRIQVGGKLLCKSDSRYAPGASTGDRIVAILDEPVDSLGVLYQLPPEFLIIEKESRPVFAPRVQGDPSVSELTDILAVFQDLLSATLGRPRFHAQ